jgi:hypothetical protein
MVVDTNPSQEFSVRDDRALPTGLSIRNPDDAIDVAPFRRINPNRSNTMRSVADWSQRAWKVEDSCTRSGNQQPSS